MKTILLAAAAVIAMPAFAQTTTATATPTPDQSQTMQNGQTMPAQSGQSMPMQNGQMPMQNGQAAPMTQSTGDPTGGQPPMNGAPMAGQSATFQQPQDVNTAFPPPPAPTGPLPFCKAGQYDNCREHSTARGARSHRTPR